MKLIAPVLAVVSGWLGQSQPLDAPPIPWTECAWICEDGSGNIYLPDGWRIRAGDHTAGKMKHAVPFRLYCDGCSLYGWDAPKRSVRKVRAVDDGLVDDGEFCWLPHANYSLHFIPSALECGVASGRKVLALDRTAGNVIAVSSDGRIEPPLFSFADKEYAQLVRSVGVLPQTGDLLLGTYWPDCRIYRFRPDGTELRNASWPFRTRSDAMVFSGGRLWAMSGQVAQAVDDSLAVREDGAVGRNAYIVRGIARGAGGWWLATTQGAQFYADADTTRSPSCRIGGLADVDAVGILEGRILVAARHRLLSLWLDDRADDPLASDERWLVHADSYDGRCSGIEARDGIFLLRDVGVGKTWAFNPKIANWMQRHMRQHATNLEVNVIRPLEARENGWTVRYDPVRRGLLRTRDHNLQQIQPIPIY